MNSTHVDSYSCRRFCSFGKLVAFEIFAAAHSQPPFATAILEVQGLPASAFGSVGFTSLVYSDSVIFTSLMYTSFSQSHCLKNRPRKSPIQKRRDRKITFGSGESFITMFGRFFGILVKNASHCECILPKNICKPNKENAFFDMLTQPKLDLGNLALTTPM